MSGYIDIHVHLLPGIDEDGPPGLKSSLELAQELVNQGFATVIATPHSLEGAPSAEEVLACRQLFTAELEQRQIPLQVLPGSELALEPQLLRRVKSGQALTLNRGCYLLIELPVYQQLPLYTEELLFELKAHGYRPILAHPERVKAFQDEISYLYRLVEKGVYLQLTLSSLTGLLGPAVQKTAWKLLSHGLVHFMATDAHCTGRRLSATNWAVQRLERQLGVGTAETLLKANPGRLLRNEELEFPEPLPVHKSKSRFHLLKDKIFFN